MHKNLYVKTVGDLWDVVVLLEELGFDCKEDQKNSVMCLNNRKRIAFRISKV